MWTLLLYSESHCKVRELLQRERVINRDIHQVWEYASVTDFLEASTVRAGISTIHSGGLPIDLLVSPGTSDTTIFFFHGAIERRFTLPVLSGLGISGGLEANRVFISDPSLALDDGLLLAWYAGNYRQPNLQQNLVQIFEKIATSLRAKRMVFFGGSGGGFASLFFASHFQNSLALVFNPQTNIAKYNKRAVQEFTEKAFQVDTRHADPVSQLPSNVISDLCELYKTPLDSKIAYLQNLNDRSHIESHLLPFSKKIHTDNELLLIKEPWQNGHSPPPKSLLTQVLNLAVSSEDWSHDFAQMGFTRVENSCTEKLP